MAYNDSNGILRVETSDDVSQLHSVFNSLAQSVSNAIGSNVRIWSVANVAARAAKVAEIGAANITAAKPLIVWRADAPPGRNLEYTINGSSWIYYQSDDGMYEKGEISVTWDPTVNKNNAKVLYTRYGRVVNLYVDNFTINDLSIPISGNVTNRNIFTLPTPFLPAESAIMSSGATGRMASYVLNYGGGLSIASTVASATWTGTTTVSESWSVGGTYMLREW